MEYVRRNLIHLMSKHLSGFLINYSEWQHLSAPDHATLTSPFKRVDHVIWAAFSLSPFLRLPGCVCLCGGLTAPHTPTVVERCRSVGLSVFVILHVLGELCPQRQLLPLLLTIIRCSRDLLGLLRAVYCLQLRCVFIGGGGGWREEERKADR